MASTSTFILINDEKDLQFNLSLEHHVEVVVI